MAPAKVNLFLHVGSLRADGFHPLSSLMVFADVGDTLTLAPAPAFALRVTGPFADHAPTGGDNLVLRAARALFSRAGVAAPGLELTLDKQIPAGAGLGGGSSDAAAALRLLRAAMDLAVSAAELEAIAADLGSDVPPCVAARPVLAQGRGERLSAAPALPVLPAILVRPDASAATGAVFRTFDQAGAPGSAEPPAMPAAFDNPEAVATFLAVCRNDLEGAARAVEPRIGEVLDALAAAPEPLLVRMSGSGSACFALCADAASAADLAGRIGQAHPDWWVRPCRLGGAD